MPLSVIHDVLRVLCELLFRFVAVFEQKAAKDAKSRNARLVFTTIARPVASAIPLTFAYPING